MSGDPGGHMTEPLPTVASVAVNDAIATARNLPDLIAKARVLDPGLATVLSGEALIASKTPWGVLLTAGVSYAAAKYGLGWDQTTDELVAGLGVLAGAYLMRYISPGRITGLLAKTPTSSTATSAAGQRIVP